MNRCRTMDKSLKARIIPYREDAPNVAGSPAWRLLPERINLSYGALSTKSIKQAEMNMSKARES